MKRNKYVLGIDTSNYTTSAALYNVSDNNVIHKRKLLPVPSGQCGLRQSDAVFHHTAQLHLIIEELFSEIEQLPEIAAIEVSNRPRNEDGSYMPCFTVGINCANILGSVLRVPVYSFSHQYGHIAAAVYSAKADYLYKQRFIAFHVSGGTTEAVLSEPDNENLFRTRLAGKTLDLHAGQAIDRVGVKMGLPFPCGSALEQLALQCDKNVKIKTCVKNTDCCLSGIQNICEKMLENNVDYPETAKTCLKFISKSLEQMCVNIMSEFGEMPILFAGGVMSNSIIRNDLKSKFNCIFAMPEFSTDNACGTAVLAAKKYLEEQ